MTPNRPPVSCVMGFSIEKMASHTLEATFTEEKEGLEAFALYISVDHKRNHLICLHTVPFVILFDLSFWWVLPTLLLKCPFKLVDMALVHSRSKYFPKKKLLKETFVKPLALAAVHRHFVTKENLIKRNKTNKQKYGSNFGRVFSSIRQPCLGPTDAKGHSAFSGLSFKKPTWWYGKVKDFALNKRGKSTVTRNGSNRLNTETLLLHSFTPSRTSWSLSNEKLKERFILFFPPRAKRGTFVDPNKKSIELIPSLLHWVIGLESLSGDGLESPQSSQHRK